MIPVAILVALLVLQRAFNRGTMLGGSLISLSGIVIIMVYGTFGTLLLGNGFRQKISDIVTALYYVVITLSTVGYGDIVPDSREARLFTISLIVAGLGIFASVIASALGPAISGELSRIFRPKEESMKLRNQ